VILGIWLTKLLLNEKICQFKKLGYSIMNLINIKLGYLVKSFSS